MRALRVAAEAALRVERAKRQREDRAGERSTAACRRARQEAPTAYFAPPLFIPPSSSSAGVGQVRKGK